MNRSFVRSAASVFRPALCKLSSFPSKREVGQGTNSHHPPATAMAADIYSRNKSASNPLPPFARPMKIKDSSKTTRGDNGESFVCFLSLPERRACPLASSCGNRSSGSPGLANQPDSRAGMSI